MTIHTPKFKIERVGLPQPVNNTRWPFPQMKSGDSFIVPDNLVSQVRYAAHYWQKRHEGCRFSIKKQMDGSTRCYRIK